MEMQPQATNSAIAEAALIGDNAGQTVAPCSILAMQNNFWLKTSDIASNRKQKPSDVFVEVAQNMLSGCLQTKRNIFLKMWLLFYYF